MKVINQTRWNTQHLRAFASRVAKEQLSVAQRARLTVRFKYNRAGHRDYCTGYCYLGVMRPDIMMGTRVVDRIDLAMVIAHELAHSKGWNHGDISGQARFNRVGNWREIYAWAETMPLELQASKRKQRPGVEVKIDHARRMVARWTSKQKRATTGLKAWMRKLKYFEKKQAAMSLPIDKPTEN